MALAFGGLLRTSMSYADLTRNDPNPLKRWLQASRFADALNLARLRDARVILDFGGGDGELALRLARAAPQARVVCYEPAEPIRIEALARIPSGSRVEVLAATDALPAGVADLIFCTEVFEHLPPAETDAALEEIDRLLSPGGRLIVGVPVEVGPPALPKGLFRMTRRYGEFDARWGTVLSALLGRAPAPRPQGEIAPGLAWHGHHAGFDHRRLRRDLARRFSLEGERGSPFGLPAWLASELYLSVRKPEGPRT